MFQPFTIPDADSHLVKLGIHRNTFPYNFEEISKDLYEFHRVEDERSYMEVIRTFGKKDLFFLMYFVLELPVNDPFIIARIYDAQENHHMTLDLWARFHWKSTILTFGLPIFNLINTPQKRIGIFSHTKAMAKAHMRKIKHQFETNLTLITAYQDVFYEKPWTQAPKWSEDDGIYVKRKGSFNEASVEAVGLIELPTGKHYTEAIYDDIIDLKNVETYAQLQKIERYYKMSFGCLDRHCVKRVVGTRYDYKDIYGVINKQKKWKTRIYPGEVDDEGNALIGGTPTMMTRKELDELLEEMGLYVYCLDGKTKILMGDYSIMNIEDIRPGDFVIGLSKGDKNKKARLVKTEVKRTWIKRSAKTVKINLENNDEIICTPEHKWWTGRWSGKEERREYSKAGIGYGKINKLSRVLDFSRLDRTKYNENQLRLWDYLSGFFDGEGTVSGGSLNISQSHVKHPEICKKIESVLNELGIKYNESIKTEEQQRKYSRNGCACKSYQLRGGRQLAFEFVNMTDCAKRSQIVNRLFEYSSRINSKGGKSRIKIKSIEELDERNVYAIETGTGNYIANGYVSSNSSQMLQKPEKESSQRFNEHWLGHRWGPNTKKPNFNYYILVDPASKKKAQSDSTVMWVIGTDPYRNYWLLDGVRDKLNLGEKWDRLIGLCESWDHYEVGYEEYGMQADIEFMERMMAETGKFINIIPLGGKLAKIDRIKRLIPDFQKGRWILPESLIYTDIKGNQRDLIHEYVEEEYKFFPNGLHDDMLDCQARIYEKDMNVYFPKEMKIEVVHRIEDDPLDMNKRRNRGLGWMAQ